MAKHTPEPWGMGTLESDTICESGGRGCVIYRPGGNRPLSLADMERIVACVNALAGIPDPEAFVKAVKRLTIAARKIVSAESGSEDEGEAVVSFIHAEMDLCKVWPEADRGFPSESWKGV